MSATNTAAALATQSPAPQQRKKNDKDLLAHFLKLFEKYGPLSIVVLNHKGGVGKSMLVRELMLAIAALGIDVAGIDTDPQANLSRRLGFGPFPNDDGPPTLADAIRADQSGIAADILVPGQYEGAPIEHVSLLPASFDLDNRESETGLPGATNRLFNVMEDVLTDCPVRIWDCRPSLGHLTQQALIAAGKLSKRAYVLIVTEPEYDAMEGAAKAHQFVTRYREVLGIPNLQIGGIVVNKARHTDLHSDNINDLQATYGDLVWEPHLPLWTVLADAQNSAAPLSSFKEKAARTLQGRINDIRDQVLELH